METQPVLTWAGIVAFVGGLLALLVTFGVPITGDQTTAALAALVLAGPIVTALVARGKVTPVANPKDNTGTPLVPVTPTSPVSADSEPNRFRLEDPGR
jgi:hypothetical protein